MHELDYQSSPAGPQLVRTARTLLRIWQAALWIFGSFVAVCGVAAGIQTAISSGPIEERVITAVISIAFCGTIAVSFFVTALRLATLVSQMNQDAGKAMDAYALFARLGTYALTGGGVSAMIILAAPSGSPSPIVVSALVGCVGLPLLGVWTKIRTRRSFRMLQTHESTTHTVPNTDSTGASHPQ